MKKLASKILSVMVLTALIFTVTLPGLSMSAEAATSSSKTISGIKATTIKAKTTQTENGKIKISWTKSKGYSVDYYQVYRATSKSGEYKKISTTKTGKATSITNTSLKTGKTYYYKVRGVRTVNGKKYYTKWSNIASHKVKAMEMSYNDIPDTMKSSNGKYQIAMILDVGSLKDGSYNEATWNGCKKYAYDNGLSYKYYKPANGLNASDDDRIAAMTKACKNGAEVVVVSSFLNEVALSAVAPLYPNVQFIFLDGWDLGYDNIIAVSYEEAEAGYLAGYAAVMEGFTSLGFSGGGGGYNPAVGRYGYGFAQGADAAASELGVEVELRYSYEYGESFSESEELEDMLTYWYEDGTEVIFVCGGSMFYSALKAAETEDGYVIGVDVDQSGEAKRVITSAMKSLDGSVQNILAKYYKSGDVSGGSLVLGAADDAVCLPTAASAWRMKNWTVKEYNSLLAEIKDGTVTIDNTFVIEPEDFDLYNVNIIY